MIPRSPWRRRRMKKPRKVIVEIATSADGYIARLDGDVSWLDRPQPKGHCGMGAFMKSIDTILWGERRTAKLQDAHDYEELTRRLAPDHCSSARVCRSVLFKSCFCSR